MKAVLLVGGKGTRLAEHLPSDTPKAMADINGKPFLEHLILYLKKQNFSEIILSVGHLKEKIIDYFGDNFQGVKISYSIENEPLGTGGAILNAIKNFDSKKFIVMNGDSFQEVNFNDFLNVCKNSKIAIALREVENAGRYGRVEVLGDKITDFQEKGFNNKGLINSGCYLINKKWFLSLNLPKKFSFEYDFLMKFCKSLEINYYLSNGYFVDIGIIEDYQKAKIDIPKLLNVAN
ncbi:MAG: nucleotidyltransferase family protein [Rickettsiales bacterium]|nr:nucleotidyltransferase family protein [Rickettsiales bacterium]